MARQENNIRGATKMLEKTDKRTESKRNDPIKKKNKLKPPLI